MSSLPIFIKYLIVWLISMVPIVELRGAIPIAESLGLDIFIYYPIAIIGNMLPVPIIFLFARKVLEWGKDKKYLQWENRLPFGEMSRPLWSCRIRMNKQIIIRNKYNYKLILKIQLN